MSRKTIFITWASIPLLVITPTIAIFATTIYSNQAMRNLPKRRDVEGLNTNIGSSTSQAVNQLVVYSPISTSTSISIPQIAQETPFFVFVPFVNDPRDQGHGTMHKVGVSESIANEFPQIMSLLPRLLNSNGDRDLSLITEGVTPKLAYRYWRLHVHKAVTSVEGHVELSVYGSTGAERCGQFCDGEVVETWRVSNNQLVLISRNAGAPPFMSNTVGAWDGSYTGAINPAEIE